MKKILYILLLLCSCGSLSAQEMAYGNEWYQADPSRTFIKMQLVNNGVYRVFKSDLEDAGYDLTGVNPDLLQLYYRGQEEYMYVEKLAGTDWLFFEFYGRRNDGRIDSVMYKDPISAIHQEDLQPNVEVSIFSDTSAYFLTWGNTGGRRYLNHVDNAFFSYTPETSFKYESRVDFRPGVAGTSYSRGGGGAFDPYYTLNSDYIIGEGFVGPSFDVNNTYQLEVPTTQAVGGTSLVKARVFGKSKTTHTLSIQLNGNATAIIDSFISPEKVYIKTYQAQTNIALGNTSILEFFAVKDQSNDTDNNNVCWGSITYDRNFNLDGRAGIMMRDWEKNQNTYFNFTNVNGTDSVFIFDLTNRVRSQGVIVNGGEARIIVPALGGKRNLFFIADNGIQTPIISPNSLSNLHNPDEGAEFVIITHRNFQASAEEYKTYRDTNTVNSLSSKIVYVDQIYDEYGYGTVTPWAIKGFCKDALDNWTVTPKYFLLWGKGKYLTRDKNNVTDNVNYVPTFGYPATDYEYVSNFNLSQVDVVPRAGVGRVNIYSNQSGRQYLNKVNQYEHSEWDSWMKQGVFLGGGGTPGEQSSIGSIMNFIIDVFEDIPYGGDPLYFQKTSSSTIDDPSNASYHDVISSGASIIHFFGHSTSNIQDIVLKEPYEYSNFGRYPFIVANGCYGGDFTGGVSFGERYITEPNRGAIGYLANSSAGYLNPLGDYSKTLYTVNYNDMLGERVGDIIAQTISQYFAIFNGKQYKNHAQQLNLQGDPSIRLYYPERPDLEVNTSSVFFTPNNFTSLVDSFTLNIIIQNLGLAVEDSFKVGIRQRLPNGTWFNHPSVMIEGVALKDTVSVVLQNTFGVESTGANQFEVFVDSTDIYTEYLETNNLTTVERVIPGNIPATLFPTEYAVIEDEVVQLIASVFFMTNETDVGYIFEIDTTSEFNSPLLTSSGVVRGKATHTAWEVPFPLTDSTVYFWRVRLSDVSPSFWGESSFRYINARTGWAQAKFPQFLKDEALQLRVDPIQQEWAFGNFGINYLFNVKSDGSFEYFVNGGLTGSLDAALIGPPINGVGFVVIDEHTLQPKTTSVYNDAGFLDVAPSPDELFKLENAILNAKEGDFIAVGSNYLPKINLWPNTVFNALKLIGVSDNVELLEGDDRFLILGQKGGTNNAIESYVPVAGGKYEIEETLLANYDQGSLNSTVIGPSISWQELIWDWTTQDEAEEEYIDVKLYGVRADDTDSMLVETFTRGTYDLSTIDPVEFPFVRLEAAMKDSIYKTAPQLEHWHVLFVPAPDAVVNPIDNYLFSKDTVTEGETVFLQMGATNVTATNMDSLLVRFSLEKADRTAEVLDDVRLAPLLAGQDLFFSYSFDSRNRDLEGDVKLIVELNPDGDQPEQYLFNNTYIQNFFVETDKINPLLDVTFDGKHIINGDIVSPTPEILVEVNDENQFIAIEDTGSIALYFGRANSIEAPERVYIGDSRIEWEPAQLPDNKARLRFHPGQSAPLEDDEYVLRVQGRDEKGNFSGKGDVHYEIEFEVVNQSTITDVLNYPNPFSSSTRFVYTLTGDELPEVFQIHIYTLTGKMVRMIDLVESGDVQIGRNITEYAWNGTDEFGDQLANGVYIYKTVIKMPNETLTKVNETTQQYFNKGWGKMYLMR